MFAGRSFLLSAAVCGCLSPATLGAQPLPASAVKWAIHAEGGPAPPGANQEVVAVHNDKLRQPAVLKAAQLRTEVWIKPLDRGQWAMALFNKSGRAEQVDVVWKELGLNGSPRVRDLSSRVNRGKVHGGFAEKLPPGGAALFLVTP